MVFPEQLLRLLLVDFDLYLVALFSLFHLAILVPDFRFAFFELSPRDFPERVDLVAFELEEVAFFTFSLQLNIVFGSVFRLTLCQSEL